MVEKTRRTGDTGRDKKMRRSGKKRREEEKGT